LSSKSKHNYFDGLTKLFSDLYLVKFLDILDISIKSFFFRVRFILCIFQRSAYSTVDYVTSHIRQDGVVHRSMDIRNQPS